MWAEAFKLFFGGQWAGVALLAGAIALTGAAGVIWHKVEVAGLTIDLADERAAHATDTADLGVCRGNIVIRDAAIANLNARVEALGDRCTQENAAANAAALRALRPPPAVGPTRTAEELNRWFALGFGR